MHKNAQIFFSNFYLIILLLCMSKSTSQNLFSPLSKEQILLPLKEIMHITQILLPLFVNHQQRVQSKIHQTNYLPLFVKNKEIKEGKSNQSLKIYMRYTFMKRKTLS